LASGEGETGRESKDTTKEDAVPKEKIRRKIPFSYRRKKKPKNIAREPKKQKSMHDG